MKRYSVALLLAGFGSPLVAEQPNPAPGESIVLEALPVSPPGVLSAVIHGQLDEPGTYVLRNRWPPNSSIAPHTHGNAIRVYTVMEGEAWWGFGDEVDEARLVRLGPGSVAYTAPGMEPHYFRAGPEGVVFNVVAEGPFVTEMVGQ